MGKIDKFLHPKPVKPAPKVTDSVCIICGKPGRVCIRHI